jgi:hypothetical protein
MKRIPVALSAVVVFTLTTPACPAAESAADVPCDRVLAIYFHRTERCPTCLKMGAYAEEAVKNGYADQISAGIAGFHYVDFQDPKNAALAKGYGIAEPALVVARIANNKVVRFADLTDIWTKVSDKPAFVKYVQDSMSALEAPSDRIVAMYFHRTQRCPTCRKMGGYAEEAVKTKYAKGLHEGAIAFYYVDFEKPENAALVKRYEISGPALILARVRGNKLSCFENLGEIWSKVSDKDAFVKYVQGNIEQFREESAVQGGK